ncbi:uncharacterized protein N7515_009010 [Penicillium bovifimosum]|uniref:Zn(2)-C6 fungal-type domain-containing protein n=1 Tax=Penicillium bovifimosum TaxID=126998 RepID=A0A9W9GJK4_9EURO|nr:uncharacterized protein N7515_009010 [Penicillium bovifimosum]KAJ5121049.1 hypothetical protein N7515_009010 [Penicillium bovifimosum]
MIKSIETMMLMCNSIDPQLHAKTGSPRRLYTPTRPTMATGPEYPEPPSHNSLNPYQIRDMHEAPHPSFGPNPDVQRDPNDPPGDAKRPRACEPCRQLKVRCDPDPAHPEGSCKRCAKARRTCVVTAPTRKRAKKTDTRVAELERKIDALTASLQVSNSPALFSGVSGQPPSPKHDEQTGRRWMGGEQKIAGNKRRRSDEQDSSGLLAPRYSRPGSPSAEQIPQASKLRKAGVGASAPAVNREAGNEFADMIDRGIIDLKTASAAFDRYVQKMAPELPFVVFPPGTTMGEVRRNKPYLFLAIVAAAVGAFNSDAQPILVNETYRQIAEQAVIKGHKSLELVQTILVCSIWYLPPDNFEELKYYSLTHMAVIMAMDLGLNRRVSEDRRTLNMLRELISKKPLDPAFDPDGPEARRTWVGCYYLSVQTVAALRRIHLVTWQPYMDESLEILEIHADALPSDRTLKWWAKLARIMEDAGRQLYTDVAGSVATFAESKMWYSIKALEGKLAQWKEEVPRDVYTEPLIQTEHVLNLFVHESAMSVDYNTVNHSSPQDSLHSSSIVAIMDALNTTIRSIHQSIDIICTVDIDRLISLPTTSIARTSYPVISLIKIYSLFMSPDSQIGHILDVQSLQLDHYLDKVIAHYRTAAARDGGRAAAKFGNILVLLRNWFIKKRDQGDQGKELKDVFANEQKPSGRAPAKQDTNTGFGSTPTQMAPGMTPLHFLSEVAMGDPAHRTATNTNSQRSIPSYPTNPNPSPSSTNQITPNSSFADPSQSWSSSLPCPTPLQSDSQIDSRAYYQPYPSDASQTYPDLPYGTQSGYLDMSGGMQLAPPMGMAELSTDLNEDSWFTLGNLMDEGLVTFPLSFDGNFGLL